MSKLGYLLVPGFLFAMAFTATAQDGSRIEVNGCDIFTFRDGKIAVKNSFRKIRT